MGDKWHIKLRPPCWAWRLCHNFVAIISNFTNHDGWPYFVNNRGHNVKRRLTKNFFLSCGLPSKLWLAQQVQPIVVRYLGEMSRHYFDWNGLSVAQCILCYYLTDTFRWWSLSLGIKVPRAIIIPSNTNYFHQLKYFKNIFCHCLIVINPTPQ